MGKHVDENRPLIFSKVKPVARWDRPYVLEWDWGYKGRFRKRLGVYGESSRPAGLVRVYTDEIGD